VVALEEVVDDDLPVGGDVVGEPMGECELVDVWRVLADLCFALAGLVFHGRGVGVEVDVDEPAELFHPDRVKADIGYVEVGRLSVWRATLSWPVRSYVQA
jgi:hypothetical protein